MTYIGICNAVTEHAMQDIGIRFDADDTAKLRCILELCNGHMEALELDKLYAGRGSQSGATARRSKSNPNAAA